MDHRVKRKESKKRDKYWNLAREQEKAIEDESDSDINYNSRTRYSHRMISTGIWGLGSKKTIGQHANSNIVEISQNTKKSPEYLKIFVVTHTTVS